MTMTVDQAQREVLEKRIERIAIPGVATIYRDLGKVITECHCCNGSGYLMNEPGLGPCVCVTPTGRQILSDQLADAYEDLGERQDTLDEVRGDLDDALTYHQERDEAVAEAGAALSRYLTRIGLPSHPVTLEDQDLQVLVDALIYEE